MSNGQRGVKGAWPQTPFNCTSHVLRLPMADYVIVLTNSTVVHSRQYQGHETACIVVSLSSSWLAGYAFSVSGCMGIGAFVCCSFFFFVFFWPCVLDEADQSAFQSMLNSSFVSYRISARFYTLCFRILRLLQIKQMLLSLQNNTAILFWGFYIRFTSQSSAWCL